MGDLFKKTKRGATSIYIVVFATILFGVVTLSFIRIMLSEASQSSNDDLSQSAYDSAMAGVEDAKVAVNTYYRCLNDSDYSSSCAKYEPLITRKDDPDCAHDYKLGDILYNSSTNEVPITASGSSDNSADQAYTCVIVTDVTPDYRSTLTSDTRTKVIPLGVTRPDVGGTSNSSTLGQVSKIRFSWFSRLNSGNITNGNGTSTRANSLFTDKATIPPTVSLNLIKVPQNFDLNTLHQADNVSGVVNSTMVLVPTETGDGFGVNTIASGTINELGNTVSRNEPVGVKCNMNNEFACEVDLSIDGAIKFNDGDNAFLIASLPYGDAITDFSVTLFDNDGNAIKFRGVQISVDSTGRTNQLFRRVETRLDPADLFFPYPQYAVELSGDGDGSLLKNFWITANCWYNQPATGQGGACPNNGRM